MFAFAATVVNALAISIKAVRNRLLDALSIAVVDCSRFGWLVGCHLKSIVYMSGLMRSHSREGVGVQAALIVISRRV